MQDEFCSQGRKTPESENVLVGDLSRTTIISPTPTGQTLNAYDECSVEVCVMPSYSPPYFQTGFLLLLITSLVLLRMKSGGSSPMVSHGGPLQSLTGIKQRTSTDVLPLFLSFTIWSSCHYPPQTLPQAHNRASPLVKHLL